jgi:D-alanyl-D-alanine carboxypeptidase (penicillin-binding protein 5/6)
MRTFIALLPLIAIGTTAAASPVYRGEAPVAYLLDMQTGNILVDRASKRRIPTASMAKMMTALVAFDAMKTGEVKADHRYEMRADTWQAWQKQGSTMFLRANERVSVTDLLHGILTLSGNDAAIMLAEGMADSEKRFTMLMNEKARQLAMRDTHFASANGWPDGGKTYSTARDLAVLGQHIILDHPGYYRTYFGQKEFRWGGVTQANRNPLLGAVEGADGLKTGHSDEAGYCLAGTAERKGRRLIMVIAGLPSQESRLREARALINWGFDRWQSRTYFLKGATVANVPVQLGTSNSVAAIAPYDLGATFPITDAPPKSITVLVKGPVKAPIKKGAKIAQLVVRFANGEIRQLPLVAGTSVDRTGFLGRSRNGLLRLLGL